MLNELFDFADMTLILLLALLINIIDESLIANDAEYRNHYQQYHAG
ncbi:hypothetical protein [Nitrosomonas communis]|nr:hypothetical protein [Nitrosomonas communis]